MKDKKRELSQILSKLDPLLLLGVERADKEDIKSLKAVKQKLPSVKSLHPGIQSLQRQMSDTNLKRFLRTDKVSVMVATTDNKAVAKVVADNNGTSNELTSDKMLVRIPRTALKNLAQCAEVSYVEASTRLELHCDAAHRSTGLFVDNQRTVPQTGKGVLVGIIDSGIDTSHEAFKKDGKTRIIEYWDQIRNRRYNSAQIDQGKGAESPDTVGHGTHVAGIAAGNGGGSPGNIYQGVAPEADLAVVQTTMETGDIAKAIKDIFKLADKRKQPCVINLSLGGHFGAHDGTTIAERAIDQLCGPGKLVVVSAGNENQSPIHAGTILPREQPEPTRWVADFELKPGMYDGRMLGLIALQVWYHHEDELTIQLRSPNGELFTAPMNSSSEVEKDNYYVSVNHRKAHYSGDNVVTFQVVTQPLTQLLGGWSIIVTESTTGGLKVGSVHAWIASRSLGGFTSGNSQSCLVGMPGTAYSAITVASYATRKEWESQSLTQPHITLDAMNLEDISYFSSEGPTRDGQNKPEIAAPGQYLISTLSSAAQPIELPMEYRVKDIDYVALQGTSMAAPYVTGALALLLEKDGTIDWAEAKRRLIKSARLGAYTGPCWNPRWGYGKINVEKLLTIEPT
jgi:subtilisin family serine protease